MFSFLQVTKLLSALGFTKGYILYTYAKSQIGKKKSGILAPIEVGCVEAVNRIHKECFGSPIDSNVSTTAIFHTLNQNFKQIYSPQLGDIIICYGFSNGITGHIGVISDKEKIMSNNSKNGLWDEHLDLESWNDRWVKLGGFTVYYFRPI